MPENLEHTIIHYEHLFKDRKPMEAYQLVTLGYRNLHAKYGNCEIWGKNRDRVLLEVIENPNTPRHYKLDFQYSLKEGMINEFGALAIAVRENKNNWSKDPNN